MANKKALVRLEEGTQAISTATSSAELLDAALEKRLGPAEAGDEKLRNSGFVLRIARELAHLHHRYETAREKLARVRDGNVRWRMKRDDAFEKVYRITKRVRRFCRKLYGVKQADAFLGLRGTLPRDPRELYQAVQPLIGRIDDAEWPMPRNPLEGVKIDRHELAGDLAAHHRDLGHALAALDEGAKLETITLAIKNDAEQAFRTYHAKGSRLIEAALEFAGLDELAATVRPAGRRPVAGIVTPELPPGKDVETAENSSEPDAEAPPAELIAAEKPEETT